MSHQSFCGYPWEFENNPDRMRSLSPRDQESGLRFDSYMAMECCLKLLFVVFRICWFHCVEPIAVAIRPLEEEWIAPNCASQQAHGGEQSVIHNREQDAADDVPHDEGDGHPSPIEWEGYPGARQPDSACHSAEGIASYRYR